MALNMTLKDLVYRYNSSGSGLPDATVPYSTSTSSSSHENSSFSKTLVGIDHEDSSLSSHNVTTISSAIPIHTDTSSNDSSILAKITLLLVITAVVLIASYKFVVRLFLGYADRKDDVLPDGFSDDEDSAVVKRIATAQMDIG